MKILHSPKFMESLERKWEIEYSWRKYWILSEIVGQESLYVECVPIIGRKLSGLSLIYSWEMHFSRLLMNSFKKYTPDSIQSLQRFLWHMSSKTILRLGLPTYVCIDLCLFPMNATNYTIVSFQRKDSTICMKTISSKTNSLSLSSLPRTTTSCIS